MERKDLLEQTETRQGKKTWITPEILDSPVITLTEGAIPNPGSYDGNTYS